MLLYVLKVDSRSRTVQPLPIATITVQRTMNEKHSTEPVQLIF